MTYQYKNILFEYQEFEEYISIIDVQVARPSMNRVFEIPEKLIINQLLHCLIMECIVFLYILKTVKILLYQVL